MKHPLLAAAAAALALVSPVLAWDYEGHRIVNQLALAALPSDFPEFVVRSRKNAERIAFLAGDPDRWRNVDPWLKQVGPSWTDHFLDLEELTAAGLDPRTVSPFRYDFVVAFAAGRAANPQHFRVIDPAKNLDHTREWPGFAPWAIAEWTQKLRSAFAYLKAYREMGGTRDEIANAEQDVIYAMGILGHYVGDCAQPLHTTDKFNGWTGPNPNGYTNWTGIHSWVDGGIASKGNISLKGLRSRVKPAEGLPATHPTDGRDPIFVAAMEYIIATHEFVEPLYQLEKAGKLGRPDQPVSPEAKAFVEERMLAGGQMLAKLWITAWKSAPVDTYLRSQLAKRNGLPAPAAPGK